MKKMTYFVMALALVLGFTQCKKEQIEPQGGQVRITLNVDNGNNNGDRVNVNGPYVTFTQGDQILVACQGQYIGTLTHNGSYFDGQISDPVDGEHLYFYFFGNKAVKNNTGADIAVGDMNCNVVISDQTTELPVISMAPSEETYPSEGNHYTASLHNKCSLMKFEVTTNPAAYGAPICIIGMRNKVTVYFNKFENDDAFAYSEDGDGLIKMKGVTSAGGETWAIVLETPVLYPGDMGTAYTNGYKGCRPSIGSIWNTHYYDTGIAIDITTEDDSRTINLGDVAEDIEIGDGYRVYGTLGSNVKISIAEGATVTLDGVSINANGAWNSGNYAGITCKGNATIILKDGSTNTVKGFYKNYPGIFAAVGHTLIIKGGAEGTGKLNASSNGEGAGIGGGSNISCGNIEIQGGVITATGSEGGAGIGSGMEADCGAITISGGTVTATGGSEAAGIGSGGEASCGAITITGGTVTATGVYEGGAGIGSGIYGASCGAITITGGTVTATGGSFSAGIGSGFYASCDNITITNGVTKVTATKGVEAPNSIGAGDGGDCGTVTIGCTLDGDGNPVGGQTGPVTTSPLVYPTPEQTITWTSSNLEDVRLGDFETTKTIKGITATISSGGHWNVDSIDGTVIFSSSTYTTFKSIEITCSEPDDVPSDWSYGGGKLTWTGSSSSVSMTTPWIGGISKIVFTVQ